jgi:hypothetical protein
MHIAHPEIGQVLTVEQLAELIGLKRRQIAYLAPIIPGAVRPDGYHYEYRVTLELLDWIEWKRNKVERRRQSNRKPSSGKGSGIITIQGIRQEFDIWLRRVGRLDGILGMPPEDQQDILSEIRPIARLYSQLAKR